MTAVDQPTRTWTKVCRLDQLVPGRGVAAKVAGRQVALFRWFGNDNPGGDYPVVNDHNGRIPPGNGGTVYALDNRDPFSGAQVMSRGIVGDKGGIPKVAAPIFKQSFDLHTGQCLDDEKVTLATYAVRITDDGWVEVEVESPS